MKNILKVLIIVFITICSYQTYGQDKIYILTERFSTNNNTSLNEIIITDPTGASETITIPHFISDPSGHDIQLSIIINKIASKGFKLVELGALVHNDFYNTSKSISYRTLFFIKEGE